MERRNLALLCAGVLCFWLFALAFGSAQGAGLRVQVAAGKPDEAALVSAPAAQETAAAAEGLSLTCRAAMLVEPESGRVLYEKNPDERVPIASITKLMTLLLTFEAIHGGKVIPSGTEKLKPIACPGSWYGSCPIITTFTSSKGQRLKALVLATRESLETLDSTRISLSGFTTLDQGVQFRFPPFPSI